MTLWSLAVGLLWFTAAAEIVVLLRRKANFFTEYGVTSLYVCIGAALFRVFVPVEFPWTVILYSHRYLPLLWDLLRAPLIFGVSILQLLAFLWIAGGVYTSFRYIRLEYNYMSFLNGCPTSTTAQIERLSEELGLPRGLACIHPAVSVPMSLGLFRPRILLTDQSFTDDELRFLLLHEYTHLKHHDAWVKLLFLVLRCVLWWDLPVCRLYGEIDNMLEFRCDRAVTKGLGVRDRARYLMLLEKVAVSQCPLADDRFGFSVLTVFRQRADEDILITRSIAVQKRKEPTLLVSVLTVVVLVLVFMLS